MFRGGQPAMPAVMPMTAAVAPRFAARYPDVAIVFDNLHAMHDVVSDILAFPEVTTRAKRAALLAAAARYRDDSSSVTTREAWLQMSGEMGVDRMGGVAVPRAPP
jgi:hypothetical protein